MESNKGEKIKGIIAEQLGVEIDDIDNEDSLREDLHMSASDLTDLVETFNQKGIDTSKINLLEIETVEDLIEEISLDEY